MKPKKRCIDTMFGLKILSPHILALIVFKVVYAVLLRKSYFQLWCLFPHRLKVASLSLLCGYFHGKRSGGICSLVQLVQTFTSRTRHTTSTKSNHLFPRILNIRRNVHIHFLTSSSEESIVIFPPSRPTTFFSIHITHLIY